MRGRALALAASLLFTGCSTLSPPQSQRADTYAARLETLALIQTLSADILASTSATRSLEQWCREHEMAEEPRIVATRVPGVDKPATAEQLERLGVKSPEEVKYRRVQLRCGAHVLSEADNWYVPARLTKEMNEALETTDAPFGRVIQPLQPYRRTFLVRPLWSPLPPGWELRPERRWRSWRRRSLTIPKELFEHRAVLYTAAHEPFSEVHETYQGEVLAFSPER